MGTNAARETRWRVFTREVGATLRLASPLVVTNLAQTAMTTTDVLMAGWIGPRALAAGALGANLFMAFLIFGIGLTGAAAPMVAREVGAGAGADAVRRTVRQGFWAALTVALPACAVLWHAQAIMLALGQEPDLAALAGDYVRRLEWSAAPALLFSSLRGSLSALRRPGGAMAIGVAAVGLNAALDWVLMFGHLGVPAQGLIGSGVATTLSSLVMAAALAVVATRDPVAGPMRLFAQVWRADWPRYRAMMRLGLPFGAAAAFEVTVFNAAVFLMGLIGPDALAAHAIALQIASLTFMVPMGVAQATTVRVGHAFGARDVAQVGRAGWAGLAVGEAFMALTALVMLAAPLLLIRGFLDVAAPENAGVVAAARTFLAMAALFQLADGAQVIGAGMLRGLHDARVPMVYALFGYWGVGLPLGTGLAFAGGFGGVGIWVGLTTGLFIVAGLMLARWTRRDRLGLTRRA